MTRLDVGLAAAGVALAAVWVVAGFVGDSGAVRDPASSAVGVVGAALGWRASAAGGHPRDPRLFAGAAFFFCGAIGLAERLASDAARAAVVVFALAAIVTVGLRSLRHS
jgi:hypothetical protein